MTLLFLLIHSSRSGVSQLSTQFGISLAEVNMKKFQSLIAMLVLITGIVVVWVVIKHREQKNVVTVDKVELNGNLHHAIVRSRTTQYTIFCQDIPEISCLQLQVAEKHPFNVAGIVL
jgi:hypothetical protein